MYDTYTWFNAEGNIDVDGGTRLGWERRARERKWEHRGLHAEALSLAWQVDGGDAVLTRCYWKP